MLSQTLKMFEQICNARQSKVSGRLVPLIWNTVCTVVQPLTGPLLLNLFSWNSMQTFSYTGLFCQITWCQIQTCFFGDCELTDSEPGFRCNCLPRHFGRQCQLTKTQCRKQICHNSGECVGNSSHLQCICDENTPEKTGEELPNVRTLYRLLVVCLFTDISVYILWRTLDVSSF